MVHNDGNIAFHASPERNRRDNGNMHYPADWESGEEMNFCVSIGRE